MKRNVFAHATLVGLAAIMVLGASILTAQQTGQRTGAAQPAMAQPAPQGQQTQPGMRMAQPQGAQPAQAGERGTRMGGRRGGGARGRVSPHETIYSRLDNNRVLIVYGRPLSRDPQNPETIRKIWGDLVPWGARWRLGSDEATLFITKSPLQMGDLTIPAGAYSLYMMPMENETSKLIVNKEIGQWGIGDPYHEELELGRVDLKKDAVDPQVDQLTLSIEANPGGGSVLKITWEKTVYSVAYTVKK